MWVVESPSPASSGPPTPLLTPAVTSASFNTLSFPGPAAAGTSASTGSSHTASSSSSVSATTVPGANLSGRLTGVISLTDILNQFGLASGLHPQDPAEVRKQRRRSSSSSLRRSVESSRSESVGTGSSLGDLSRRESVSGRR
jgi:hypothetical protein